MGVFFRWLICEFFTGNVFNNKFAGGLVIIEVTMDIGPVAPGMGPRKVVGEARRVGVAHHVEPVAGAYFAVAR